MELNGLVVVGRVGKEFKVPRIVGKLEGKWQKTTVGLFSCEWLPVEEMEVEGSWIKVRSISRGG